MLLFFLNQVIILNFNDTIVNYSNTIINILNKKYDLNKTYKDLKDKNFKSIYKNITLKEIEEIKNSEEYIKNIKFSKDFIDTYNEFNKDFTFVINNNGLNDKEKKYIEDNTSLLIYDIKNIPLFKKYIIIDDDTKKLSKSESQIKILLSNNKPWNQMIYNEEIYELYSWNDIKELLNYIKLKGW